MLNYPISIKGILFKLVLLPPYTNDNNMVLTFSSQQGQSHIQCTTKNYVLARFIYHCSKSYSCTHFIQTIKSTSANWYRWIGLPLETIPHLTYKIHTTVHRLLFTLCHIKLHSYLNKVQICKPSATKSNE